MSLTYFFEGATALPWITTTLAYSPSVDIDILVPLLSLILLVANVHALRRRERPRLVDPDTGLVAHDDTGGTHS